MSRIFLRSPFLFLAFGTSHSHTLHLSAVSGTPTIVCPHNCSSINKRRLYLRSFLLEIRLFSFYFPSSRIHKVSKTTRRHTTSSFLRSYLSSLLALFILILALVVVIAVSKRWQFFFRFNHRRQTSYLDENIRDYFVIRCHSFYVDYGFSVSPWNSL